MGSYVVGFAIIISVWHHVPFAIDLTAVFAPIRLEYYVE